MPIYEYVCMACESHFEELVRNGEEPDCPDCGAANVRRQLSVFAAIGESAAAELRRRWLLRRFLRMRALDSPSARPPRLETMDQAERLATLDALQQEAAGCTRCRLAEGRTQVVFGVGDPNADLMFVGEAPGFHEDKQGFPFVGQAGKLLDKLLAGIGLERADVYIANVIKCRPPGNRDPVPDEIEACEPYLFRQIELIEPRVIATLGNFATKLLSGKQLGITRVHGQTAGRDARRPARAALPALSPGGGALHAEHADGARGGLRAAAGAARFGVREPVRARARARARRGGAGRAARSLLIVTTSSAAETEEAGARLGAQLRAGDVVLVAGELGSGKTTFVRGACRALGVEQPVTSPTYTIGNRYEGRVPVSHLDLYRLSEVGDADWAGLEPYFEDAVVFVEWPEAGAGRLPEAARDRPPLARGREPPHDRPRSLT